MTRISKWYYLSYNNRLVDQYVFRWIRSHNLEFFFLNKVYLWFFSLPFHLPRNLEFSPTQQQQEASYIYKIAYSGGDFCSSLVKRTILWFTLICHRLYIYRIDSQVIMSSCSTFVFLFLFSFLTSFRASAQDPTYTYHVCPNTTTFTRNSTYYTNLRTLLSSLSSPNASYSTGFQNATTGQAPDGVTGLFLCRGDVMQEVCRRCISFAVNDTLKRCPNEREVTLYYEKCMLRYSNGNILSTLNTSGERNMSNGERITSNQTGFRDLLLSTMNQAATFASNSSRKFDTVNAFANSQTLFGLVQCTPDLTSQECFHCLNWTINRLPIDSVGGRVLVPSCNSRFEPYKFYDETDVPTPPPPRPGLIIFSIPLITYMLSATFF